MNLFDLIPSNFFNLLSSQSNGPIYSGCLMEIYRQYEHEISYRIPREIIRDAVGVYLLDNHIRIEDPDISENANPTDVASAILRKFCAPEVGWLTDEIDDTTYGHNIVMTEQGIRLAEFLTDLMHPEKAEFSGYIFDIYNRLANESQWQENPYVNALSAVYKNARDLSRALKQLSTFIRDIIERMVHEETLESLTQNILDYCNGDFIREYSRLNKQQNIHVYRDEILLRLQDMQADPDISARMTAACMAETGISEAEAADLIRDRFTMTEKFLKTDYERIMSDIRHKITVYLQIAVGRARFLQNRNPDARGNVERVLKYLIEEMPEGGIRDELDDDVPQLFSFENYEFIDTDSLRYPGKQRTIRQTEETDLVTMTEEEIAEALEKQKAAAYNPYSKEKMKNYLEKEMDGALTITSDDLPMDTADELLCNLSAAAFSRENGFDIELMEGYYESHSLRLRRFEIRRQTAETTDGESE